MVVVDFDIFENDDEDVILNCSNTINIQKDFTQNDIETDKLETLNDIESNNSEDQVDNILTVYVELITWCKNQALPFLTNCNESDFINFIQQQHK